jgi:hypothetical protein
MKSSTIRAVHQQFACFNRDDTIHSRCSPPIGAFLDIDTGYVKKEMREDLLQVNMAVFVGTRPLYSLPVRLCHKIS